MDNDRFVQRIQRLNAKGFGGPAAMQLLKSAEVEALRDILIKSNLITKEDYYTLVEEIQEKYTKQFETMPPFPQ